jgi:hypothetical protein
VSSSGGNSKQRRAAKRKSPSLIRDGPKQAASTGNNKAFDAARKGLLLLGSSGTAFGFGALLLTPSHFYWAVSLILAGVVAISIEIALSDVSRAVKAVLFVVPLSLATFPTYQLLMDAPLITRSYATRGDYQQGTLIAGIEWKPSYSELRVKLENSTDIDYEDLDIRIATDQPMVALAQTSKLPGVAITDNSILVGDSIGFQTIDPKTGAKGTLQLPIHPLTTNTYRLLCQRLPKHSMLLLIGAVSRDPLTTKSDVKHLVSQITLEGEYRVGAKPFSISVTQRPSDKPEFFLPQK